MKALLQIVGFKSFAQWDKEWTTNMGALQTMHNQIEYKMDLKTREYADLDFDDFFATNPKCVKAADGKVIGLQPNAFNDFKFDKK